MLTIHHLDFSRSTRVVWLLEELGEPYTLVRYPRPVGGPAPAALAAIHPLGKSPVLVDDDFVLAESSAILRYLDARYGASRFTPQEVQARARHDEWMDYVEGSLAIPLFVPLVVGRSLPDALRSSYAAELQRAWTHIADAVGGSGFLLGPDLTLADMQMSYLLAVASATGALAEQPRLTAYLERLQARPALARAIAAGGPMA